MAAVIREGIPVVVSAPSGGGKTTLCRALMDRLGGVEFSISTTTRAPRPKEQDGVDYHFVSDVQFDRMVGDGDFLEWAPVHDNRYGSSRATTEAALARGVDVLFDIDVQGGRQIRAAIPDALLIFILPPSMQVLEERLRGRGADAEDVIQRRMQAARDEIQAATFYPYWIVNDDFDAALASFEAILVAERIRWADKQALLADCLRI